MDRLSLLRVLSVNDKVVSGVFTVNTSPEIDHVPLSTSVFN